jgi:hypothetical protein
VRLNWPAGTRDRDGEFRGDRPDAADSGADKRIARARALTARSLVPAVVRPRRTTVIRDIASPEANRSSRLTVMLTLAKARGRVGSGHLCNTVVGGMLGSGHKDSRTILRAAPDGVYFCWTTSRSRESGSGH